MPRHVIDLYDCYMTASGPLTGLGVLQCEKWCLHVSFGVYGGKE
jgi:hypothetical protein